MKKKIAQFVPKYLSHSESFIYNLTNDLPDFQSVYFATSLENREIYPTHKVVVKPNESLYESELEALQPDLIHVHFGGIGAAGLVYALRLNVPLLISFYGHDASSYLDNLPWPDYYKPIFEHCSGILVLSEFMKQQLIDKGCPEAKIKILHIGVDLQRFKPPKKKLTSKNTRFLISSRLVEKKGIKYAIHAFSELSKRHNNIELKIVGDGPLKNTLLEQIRALGLQQKVKLIPQMGQDVVLEHLQQADVFLYPSVTASDGDMEGTPVSIMEAAATRLPVIATSHAGIPQIVDDGKTGLLIAEKDTENLAKSMEKLHESPELAAKWGKAGRLHVEKRYDMAQIRQNLQEIYHNELRNQKNGCKLAKTPVGSTKILLIRSIPVIEFLHKLFFIKEQFPDTALSVLTSPSSKELCADHPLVDEVILFTGKRFSPFYIERSLRETLKMKGFEKVIVPFTSKDGGGFENVTAMAKLLNAKQVLGLSRDNHWLKFNWLQLVFGKRLWIAAIKKALICLLGALAVLFLAVLFVLLKAIGIFTKRVED